MAIRMGEVDALAQKLNCQVIPADATSVEDLQNVKGIGDAKFNDIKDKVTV